MPMRFSNTRSTARGASVWEAGPWLSSESGLSGGPPPSLPEHGGSPVSKGVGKKKARQCEWVVAGLLGAARRPTLRRRRRVPGPD
uniref:Uncharacterized protein n=1 Tax=Nomascus leucogenys TaxID=61853 RepID=A0A2I3HZR8_NOMLE